MKSRPVAGSEPTAWDRQAPSYDASHRPDPVYRSCINLTALRIPRRTTLCLDAGCGTGLSTEALVERCTTVIATDYSLESLKILKRKGFGNVLVVQADLAALPFRDSAFDASECANTIQHLRPGREQQRAVAELGRVTGTGGTMSISVHHYSRKKMNAGWIKEGRPGQRGIDYIFRFTRDDLLALIPGARITGIGYYDLMKIPVFGHRVQNMTAALFGRLLAAHGHGHMLLATKKK